MKVFISSTRGAWREHGQAVREKLMEIDHQVINGLNTILTPADWLEVLDDRGKINWQRNMEESDVFICICESVASGSPEDISVVAMEYDYAKGLTKPIFCFVDENPYNWRTSPNRPERDEAQDRLKSFRSKLIYEQKVYSFTKTDDLVEKMANIIQFGKSADELMEEFRERSSFLKDQLDRLSKMKKRLSGDEASRLHKEQVRLLGEQFAETHDLIIRSDEEGRKNKFGIGKIDIPAMRHLESRLSEGARDIRTINQWLSESPSNEYVGKVLDELEQKFKYEYKNAPRVLNANFADPFNPDSTLPLNYSLGAGREYDLRVDIGPRWIKNPSLFQNEELNAFPTQAVLENLLAPEDRDLGAFDVMVVFVGEDFTPNLVSATINVPIPPTHRSIPYIKGKLAEEAGWVSLRIQAPQIPANNSLKNLIAYGRLCLYYRNNLLQSGSVQAVVSPDPGFVLEGRNSGHIDFVLTSGFQRVKEILSTRQLQLGQDVEEAEIPVALNITLNDGSGRHRILTKYFDTANKTDVPPAWLKFIPLTSEEDLQFRQALYHCHDDLDDNFGKRLGDFKRDLKTLAKIGYSLYDKIFAKPNVEKDVNITEGAWLQRLQSILSNSAIIQVARTESADYPFPWSMVYEYEINEDPEFCPELAEWSPAGIRTGMPKAKCPYEAVHRAKKNVVCPYGFWGLKHVIEQPLTDDLDEGSLPYDPKIVVTSTQAVLGIAVTDDLDRKSLDSRKKHLTYFSNQENIHLLPNEPANTFMNVLMMLHSPEIVYFLCHGEFREEQNGQRKPYLVIGKGEEVQDWIDPNFWRDHIAEIDTDAWIKHRPLVFINGCHTTAFRPGIALNFLSSFKFLGANAVIGTEVSLLATEAMNIAESIFTKLIAGARMGDAIRAMRWELLNKGNLLGLAYTPYCFADLRIKRTT